MTLEQQLIDKTYYKMFMNELEDKHPIEVLGEAFQEEAQKDLPELTNLRYAQGEAYFHAKDYEAAIFKWENIINELEPWAKKNTADAYYKLGVLSTAEDLYTTIVTDNPTLKSELSLQLFSLYIDREKLQAATSEIKKAILANPDYPNLTTIARNFFEEQGDWENAIELAVNEAKRKQSLDWYEILHSYIQQGRTKTFAPSYFSQALVELYRFNHKKFEQLISSLWNSYQNENTYFTWLKEINYLLLNLDFSREEQWTVVSKLFKETYFHFIGGNYFIKQLEEIVPELLTNWLRLADDSHVVLSAAALLSWNELFPASLSLVIVEEAEKVISTTAVEMDELEECLNLFASIIKWAHAHDMGDNGRMQWITRQLVEFDTHHILVAGLSGTGKSSFVNMVLGEPLQDSPTSTVVMFKDAEELEITEITDWEMNHLEGFSAFQERMDRLRHALESVIEFKLPNRFLAENEMAFIDTPGLKGTPHADRTDVLSYLHVADTVLFTLDANAPLTDKERSLIDQIQGIAPDIPVHFLISKIDTIPNEQDAVRIFEETRSAIESIVPDAKVFAFSSQYDRDQQLGEMQEFLLAIRNKRNIEDKRLAKLLYYIRTTIASLLQKRIDVENQLADTVRWNQEMYSKLTGAVNQLNDSVVQKTKIIAKSYHSMKAAIEEEIVASVPLKLRECSELIREDSNFSKVHLDLNEEMNKRLQDYLENHVMPKYCRMLQDWLFSCKEEFDQGQEYLNELAQGFNSIYGEERLQLECDFRILDDWNRDINRLTSGFTLEKENILLRRTPSQFLLKSAGKLLGSLSNNKTMLYNKYKGFVENEDYTETIESVCRQFFQPFQLFEKSLERDVSLFLKEPLLILAKTAEDTSKEIDDHQAMLNRLNMNPEIFRDPLTLFELRLRQFEWMTIAGKGMQTVY
ncbi:dynamin family protein [Neobacillus dielmonensis]|uniref:dynamin family protein n=1 Tax=Neobacillus dielmonensis TaxID=1347369 RepID=UPI0005A82AA3|nr:dynamin family protein [Neobacillus dielmonensis]